jgi:hypothetical protein
LICPSWLGSVATPSLAHTEEQRDFQA